MMKKLPIGVSEFKKIRDYDLYYSDKTNFIAEIYKESAEVILITRPRRFGKTLNMRMLYSFFSNREESAELFHGLRIENDSEVMEALNRYPVIYLTFKDIKDREWSDSYDGLQTIISSLYSRHEYLIEGLNFQDKELFHRILFKNASKKELEDSVLKLSEYLFSYYNKPVIFLLDEYDVPIQSGYMRGFFDEVTDFMRNLMSAVLKDNPALFKGVMTGIYRVAKESIFSGLNNLAIYSILDSKLSTSFGFTEDDVIQMLEYYGMEKDMAEIRQWYNGYSFGDANITDVHAIYNPWSVINYIDRKRAVPYWVNTSSNDLIIREIQRNNELELMLPRLLDGKVVEKIIKYDTALRELAYDESAVWSLLVFAGYLNAKFVKTEGQKNLYSLSVPNKEVLYFFEDSVAMWLKQKTALRYEELLEMTESLLDGDTGRFKKKFQRLVLEILSYHDIGGNEPEKVYKIFVLGMLTLGTNGYRIKSEGESGLGRYDVAIIPKDTGRFGVVMEFKRSDADELDEMAENALAQIDRKKYAAGLRAEGLSRVIEMGIAISGKEMVIKERTD